jgi:hypothetical protein
LSLSIINCGTPISKKGKIWIWYRLIEEVGSWDVIFSQDLLTGVTEDIPLCGEEGSRLEIRADFEDHLWTVQDLGLVPDKSVITHLP